MESIIEWTHRGIQLTDIRKVKKFYILSVSDKKVRSPLFVDHNIFDTRLKSYFLADDLRKINRSDVLALKWNMVITQGYFLKYDASGRLQEIYKDPDKFYISFLEIDGPLGYHISVNN